MSNTESNLPPSTLRTHEAGPGLADVAAKMDALTPRQHVEFRSAIVTAIAASNPPTYLVPATKVKVTLRIAGAPPDIPNVPYLEPYIARVGDTVWVAQFNDQLLILGSTAPSGTPVAILSMSGVSFTGGGVATEITWTVADYDPFGFANPVVPTALPRVPYGLGGLYCLTMSANRSGTNNHRIYMEANALWSVSGASHSVVNGPIGHSFTVRMGSGVSFKAGVINDGTTANFNCILTISRLQAY